MKIPPQIKVSVIIANYNNATFLEDCINSVIKQSYKNLEIIVVDDNSTDNSLKVLKKYKKKITLIKNKKKTFIGSYNQMNSYYKGFLKSNGKYIFFLDSDDFFKKNKIKIHMKIYKKLKNQKILFDRPIMKFRNLEIKKKFIQKNLFLSNWPRFTPQSCISVNRFFANEIFNFIKIKKYANLWFDFRIAVLSFLKYKKILVLKDYLTYYRQHDNSASKQYKIFSKIWWKRRNEAHDFFDYLSKRLNVKKKITLDLIVTKLIFNLIK